MILTQTSAPSRPTILAVEHDVREDHVPDDPPEELGTFGPEGRAICPMCQQMATFVYLDEARGEARGVCSRCGSDWWL
jgi:hypothetical protein